MRDRAEAAAGVVLFVLFVLFVVGIGVPAVLVLNALTGSRSLWLLVFSPWLLFVGRF